MLLQRVEILNERVITKALAWFFGSIVVFGKHTTQRTAKTLSTREAVEARVKVNSHPQLPIANKLFHFSAGEAFTVHLPEKTLYLDLSSLALESPIQSCHSK